MQRVWRLLVQNQTHRGDVAHFAEELFQLIFLGLGTKSQNQDYLDTSIHYVVNPWGLCQSVHLFKTSAFHKDFEIVGGGKPQILAYVYGYCYFILLQI